MEKDLERNLGRQPIADIMVELGLKPNHLVVASPDPMTHKMVSRACKGRRLTLRVKSRVCEALNKATGKEFAIKELFNY